jgi:hypothetical protein
LPNETTQLMPVIHFNVRSKDDKLHHFINNNNKNNNNNNNNNNFNNENDKNIESNYDCPLYKTSQRAGILNSTGISTNYIMTIQLPSSINIDHWILRGTALLS